MGSAPPDISVGFDEKKIAHIFDKLGAAVDAELAMIALRAAQAGEGPLRMRIMELLSKGPTGALARSVRSRLLQKKGGIVGAVVGPDTVYAETQDQGAVIRARGKKLAVPLSRVSYPPPKGKSPKDWGRGELYLLPRPGKDPLLVSPTRGPQYVLVTSVKIPAHLYREAALGDASALMEAIVEQGLDGLLARIVV